MSGRLYALLLRLLPGGFRRRYGDEMRGMFAEQWSESGWVKRVVLVIRAVVDVIWTSLAVRVLREDGAGVSGHERKRMLTGWSADVRFALRALRGHPGYAVTAIVTVAMGIGATTSVFSVVNATVLGSLGLPQEAKLVSLWSTFDRQTGQDFPVSAAEFTDLRTDVRSFEGVGGWWSGTILLEPGHGGAARTIVSAFTVGDIYELVGARTVVGRLPGADENEIGSRQVALLSHSLWTSAYGRDPSIVRGGWLAVGLQQLEIIGVLAPDVKLPGLDTDVWVHTVLDPAAWAANRSGHGMEVIALLREGVTPAAAQRELADLERSWSHRYAGQHTFGLDGHHARAMLLRDRMLGSTRRVATVLALSAMLLLVLACANVANLLLARGETRKSEVGVRIALGATGRRVARPVLAEGLAIGLAGGFAGLLFATIGLPLLMEAAPQDLPGKAFAMDSTVVLVALILSLVTGIAFSVVPAWRAARADPMTLLRTSGRGRTGVTRGLRVLVGGQIALATILLAGATLLARSLFELNRVDPGLDTTHRIAVDLALPISRYGDAASIAAYYETLQQRLSEIATVNGVTVVRNLPLRDAQRFENLMREGTVHQADLRGVVIQVASAGYLRTMGATLLEGRDLAQTDREGSTRVALVSRAAAESLWPGESAMGKRVRALFAPSFGLITIVGVYEGMRSTSLTAAPHPELLLPVQQAAQFTGWMRRITVVLHATAPPETAFPAVRDAITDLDPSVAVESPTTLSAVLTASTARERFVMILLGVFGTLALVIAAVGVFGVVSFTVSRQTHEFAIRNSLGAQRSEIIRSVLTANAAVAGTASLVGALVAGLAAPLLRTFLYGVAPHDVSVFVGVAGVLVLVALAASLLPAIRATRVPPARALQGET